MSSKIKNHPQRIGHINICEKEKEVCAANMKKTLKEILITCNRKLQKEIMQCVVSSFAIQKIQKLSKNIKIIKKF